MITQGMPESPNMFGISLSRDEWAAIKQGGT